METRFCALQSAEEIISWSVVISTPKEVRFVDRVTNFCIKPSGEGDLGTLTTGTNRWHALEVRSLMCTQILSTLSSCRQVSRSLSRR